MIKILLSRKLVVFVICVGLSAHAQQSSDIVSKSEPTLEEMAFAVVYEDSTQTDFNHSEYHDMRNEVLAAGDESAEILIGMLESANDSMVASSVVGLLAHLQNNDKEIVRNIFREIVSGEFKVPDERSRVRRRLAFAVRAFGDPSDADYLLPLLDHENDSVRVLAVETLGLVGDGSTADEIERKLAERASSLLPEDELFTFGATALEEIRKRYRDAVPPSSAAAKDTVTVEEESPTIVASAEDNSEQLKGAFEEENFQKSNGAKVWPWIVGSFALLSAAIAYWRSR